MSVSISISSVYLVGSYKNAKAYVQSTGHYGRINPLSVNSCWVCVNDCTLALICFLRVNLREAECSEFLTTLLAPSERVMLGFPASHLCASGVLGFAVCQTQLWLKAGSFLSRSTRDDAPQVCIYLHLFFHYNHNLLLHHYSRTGGVYMS